MEPTLNIQLQTIRIKISQAIVSDIMMDMLSKMNGKSPVFVNFMVGVLHSIGFGYYEIIGMFDSKIVTPSKSTDEIEITEHELRLAWFKNKQTDIEEKEAEWFFVFCTRIGMSHLSIIRMMHELHDTVKN